MARKKVPKPQLVFQLFGLEWKTYLVPSDHKDLGKGTDNGACFYDRREIYLSEALSDEQLVTTLAHEIQHAIEDHAGIDYEQPVDPDVADRMTDQVALGWLFILRGCPDLVEVLKREKPL
jgi:Zn-dependent peptidase ImmA (M78 family)